MSNRLGMNANAIRSLADQMSHVAESLSSVLGAVEASVRGAGASWSGEDAESFHSSWSAQYSPDIAAIITDISALANNARANAREQDIASVDSPANGITEVPIARMAGPGIHGYLDAINAETDNFFRITGLPSTLGHIEHVLGPVGTSMQHGIAHDLKAVEATDHTGIVKDVVHAGGPVLDKVGYLGMTVSTSTAVLDARTDLQHHHYYAVGQDVAQGTAGDLKSFAPTYVYGVLTSEYSDVINLGHQIDWSQGLPTPTPSNLLHAYLPAFGEAFKEAPSHIWKWLT